MNFNDTLNSIITFQNHDTIKLVNSNPAIFTGLVYAIFYGVFMFLTKKHKPKSFFDKDFTTALRGFCIIVIIFGHLSFHALHNDGTMQYLPNIGSLMVPIFLFLSGYGLSESAKLKGVENFFVRKFIRIYIPFIIMNFTWIIIEYFLLHKKLGFLNLILTILGIKHIGSIYLHILYILFFLSCFYILFILKVNKKIKSILFCFILIISFIIKTKHSLIEYHYYNSSFFNINILDRNYWYILYLIFWYCVFYMTFNLKIPKKFKIIILWSISFLILFLIDDDSLYELNCFNFTIGVTVSLYSNELKNLYSKFKRLINIKNDRLLYTLIAIFSYFIYSSRYLRINDKSIHSIYYFVNLSIPVFFAILWITFTFKILSWNRLSIFYKFIGEISFELYLIHGAFMYSYDFILFKFPLYISFFVYLIFIIILSFFLNKLFNKISKILTNRLQ